MTYTLFGQSGASGASANMNPFTLGVQFAVLAAVPLNAIWFFSGSGATELPQTIALFTVSGGTLVHSETPSWSGAAGSGWVRAAFASPPSLAYGTSYVAAVYADGVSGWYGGVSAYWSTGPGSAGITNGPLTAPDNAAAANGQDVYNSGSGLTFPASTFGATNYWVDPEVGGGPFGPFPVGNPPGGPWSLVFNDDFTGLAFDTGTWATNLIFGKWWRTVNDPTINSYSTHDNRGMTVAGSALSLHMADAGAWPAFQAVDPLVPDPLPSGEHAEYETGMLSSHPGFRITEGYIECKYRFPNPAPAGLASPAFWTKSCITEIDVAEWNPANSIGMMHAGYYDNTQTYHSHYYTIPDNAYHVYGCKITATDLTWYFDGAQVYNVANDGTTPAWCLIVSTAADTSATGAGFPLQIDYDYVRAWTVTGVPAQPLITSITPATGIPAAGNITVAFNPVPGATSYRVTANYADYQADSGLSTLPATVEPATASGSASPITVTGLTAGYHYDLTVAAINATGYSIESLPVPSFAGSAGGAAPDRHHRRRSR
jgi:Domain of unknown function (DUF4082)/Glycosyl hydrolases family 16